jgi:hypothetical protein
MKYPKSMPTTRKREIRRILDPIRPGLLRIEDIRAAVRAVAAEEAAAGKVPKAKYGRGEAQEESYECRGRAG